MRRLVLPFIVAGLGACTYIYGLDDLAGEGPNDAGTTDAPSASESGPPSGSDGAVDARSDGGAPDAPFTIDCADSVVGHWPMDEGNGTEVRDRCPNALHGTLKQGDGGASWGTRNDGGCVELTGDAYVSLGERPALALTGPFSIAGFIRVDEQPGGYVGVYHNFGGTFGAELIVDYSSKAYGQVGVGSASVQTDIGPILPGKWRHLALVFVPNERLEVFLDGESIAKSVPPAGPAAPSSSETRFGAVFSEVMWKGAVDDVVVYSRALSGDQIAALARR